MGVISIFPTAVNAAGSVQQGRRVRQREQAEHNFLKSQLKSEFGTFLSLIITLIEKVLLPFYHLKTPPICFRVCVRPKYVFSLQ